MANWKADNISEILDAYEPCDIYNADETGLFWKCLPDRTLAPKGSQIQGLKAPKDRITVLVAANMDGSDKRPLLTIGKFAKPRAFKNKHIPVTYRNNKRAWMVSALFEDWVRKLDYDMQQQNRQICLLLDNCPAHPPTIDGLTNTTIKFLPPNTTSVLQPMDQGIIHSLKRHYRQLLLMKYLAIPETEGTYQVDLFEGTSNNCI